MDFIIVKYTFKELSEGLLLPGDHIVSTGSVSEEALLGNGRSNYGGSLCVLAGERGGT